MSFWQDTERGFLRECHCVEQRLVILVVEKPSATWDHFQRTVRIRSGLLAWFHNYSSNNCKQPLCRSMYWIQMANHKENNKRGQYSVVECLIIGKIKQFWWPKLKLSTLFGFEERIDIFHKNQTLDLFWVRESGCQDFLIIPHLITLFIFIFWGWRVLAYLASRGSISRIVITAI